MKLQDLEIHEDFKKILHEYDFDNRTEEIQKEMIQLIDFALKNNADHFKSPEENHNDWKAYINSQKLANGSIENKAVIFC